MSDDAGIIYRVEYRSNFEQNWKHYYSDAIKANALDMYAHHISNYSKEQCRMVQATIDTRIYEYIPVNQEDEDDS